MNDLLAQKQQRLNGLLRGLGSVLVAYSGGVDSAFLAWSAHQVLGEGMLAILADSPSLARSEFASAVTLARQHAIPLEIVTTSELENPDYSRNDLRRCFHCKSELFTVMEKEAQQRGFRHLAYGMNVDDQGDFRPGQTAAHRHGVLAPLRDAGLTKDDIRQLARDAGLPAWDKPASACLSSRVAYGQPVSREVLHRIEQGEDYLRGLGLRQFRVRDHGDLARIEIARDEMPRLLASEVLLTLAETFKTFGFLYVTLDCEGFRSGSMNAALIHPPPET